MEPNGNPHGWAVWVAVIATVNVLHLWLFFHLPSAQPVQFWITIALHMMACIGPFSMLADWFVKLRKKLHWQRWMWLFFVPSGFLWYVFEKYKSAQPDLRRTS
jgi:hypothetical protein